MLREFTNLFLNLLMPIVKFVFMRTTKQGARTLAKATAMGIESHGRFIVTDDIVEYVALCVCSRML